MRYIIKPRRQHYVNVPMSIDPDSFYQYRIQKRSEEAVGVEGLVYQLIPWRYIQSFAFAIDPFAAFKLAPGKIQVANRQRKIRRRTLLENTRQITVSEVYWGEKSIENYLNIPGKVGPVVALAPNTVNHAYPQGSPDPPYWTSWDTSYKTRDFGYTMGEFDKVKFTVYSTPRSVYSTSFTETYDDRGGSGGYPDIFNSRKTSSYTIAPTAATISESLCNEIANEQKTYLLAKMKKEALSMYKGINPQHRDSSLFRNIVELRDIPRSVATMQTTARNLIKFEQEFLSHAPDKLRRLLNSTNAVVKNIPNEYLSYHFGWKQLVKDTLDLLTSPKKISKKIDFLIRRSGKATTYRTHRSYDDAIDASSGFWYEVLDPETRKDLKHRIRRHIELDMVINTTFEFPPINIPAFRDKLFYDKLGVYPRVTDLYNLTPWTWLVDWFTGLGNYVEIIDETNKDKSIINWGVQTGKAVIELQSTHITQSSSYLNRNFNGVNLPSSVTNVAHVHDSILKIDLQLRKDLGYLLDVKSLARPESLTPYQQSILGALLAQRTKFTR